MALWVRLSAALEAYSETVSVAELMAEAMVDSESFFSSKRLRPVEKAAWRRVNGVEVEDLERREVGWERTARSADLRKACLCRLATVL